MKKIFLFVFMFALIASLSLESAAAPVVVNSTATQQPKTIQSKTVVNTGITIPKVNAQPLDLTKFSTYKSEILISDSAQTKIACGQIPNGKILVTWATKTADDKHVGEARFYDQNMGFIKSVYFTFPANTYVVGKTVILGLENNTFLIAYQDINTHTAKYVVFKDNGTPLFEPREFCDGRIDSLTLTPLPGKKTILLSYQKYSDISAQGEYQILDLAGNKIMGPIVFNDKGMGAGMEPIVTNGLINYYFGCGFSWSKTIDLFGNVIRDNTKFWHIANKAYQPILLANGNSLVLCLDQYYMPVSYLLDANGNKISGPTPFLSGTMISFSAVKLNSGHIFILNNTSSSQIKKNVNITLLDENGGQIKELKEVGDGASIYEDMIGYTILNNKKALIVYGGVLRDEKDAITQRITGYKIYSML